jgi:kynurenine formamidase
MTQSMTTPDEEAPSNWGRWGPDDERGALNYITDAARRRGVEEARIGRVVSLAEPITPVVVAGGRPGPPSMVMMPAPILQMMSYTGSPAVASVDVLTINTHHPAMTHIDALAHVAIDGQVYPGVPLEVAAAGGTIRHGSTTAFAEGIVTRGFLLDLAPGSRLEPDHAVTRADLDEAERRAGSQVESGDALVIRGGRSLLKDFMEPLPWITLDAVRWMDEREISVLASDIGDRPPAAGSFMALHAVALPRLGIPLIDGANVGLLAETCAQLGRYTFLFALGAIPVGGATGIPVNPLALF